MRPLAEGFGYLLSVRHTERFSSSAGVTMRREIFLIQNDGQLIAMREQTYDSEALLQDLLAHYPHLLVGDQIDHAQPRRWLLITREASLPSEEGGSGRWAVDHLFLDQEAVPTLVEVNAAATRVSAVK